MVQSFGIDVTSIAGVDVTAGLDLLAQPADWLMSIEDLGRLRADLERTIPELASGELRLAKCKFKRAHIDDGTYTSLCRLTIEPGGGAGPRAAEGTGGGAGPRAAEGTGGGAGPRAADESSVGGSRHDVDVHGVLLLPWMDPPATSPEGRGFAELDWHCFLPDLRWEISVEPADTALPAMPSLTDPDLSRALIQGALRAAGGDFAGITIARCTPTVMRYREGRRCTIRYELEYGADRQDAWPDGMIAKVYEGDEGRATYDAMGSLWSSPLRGSSTVRIAEPLAYIPEQNVMLQGLVPGGRSMKDLIKKTAFKDGLEAGFERLAPLVRKAGIGLGELHTSGALTGPVVTWEDRVGEVRRAGAELASVVPTLADAMEPLVTRLEALRDVLPPGPLVPTHRSFRPAQILVHDDDIAFIDFDGTCQSEPGLDLALFRATLCDLILRALEVDDRPMAVEEQDACQVRLDELCAVFLAGYLEVAEYSVERLALWDVLTSAKDILDCWRKIKFEHLERRMRFLHHKLGSV